jgi:ZIP family zinc transporter
MQYFLEAIKWSLFTYGMTAAGAALVFTHKSPPRKFLDMMLGFAGGVMTAASYFSLLAPSVEISESLGMISWIPPVVGFLLGGAVLRVIDATLPHLHLWAEKPEGIKTSWRRTTLLILAITLHNIPEGLAVGVAFGAVGVELSTSFATSLAGAISLALGIGIQNFPEGMAASIPLRREGMGMFKSFWYGQLSGLVEPIAAIFGVLMVIKAVYFLPYALAFAAGAMIYVVVEEVIPESQIKGNTDISTLGFMIGFATMMLLDVALG